MTSPQPVNLRESWHLAFLTVGRLWQEILHPNLNNILVPGEAACADIS